MEITTMNQAMQIHALIIKTGKYENINNLITFSALSINGNLTYAHQIFNSHPNPNSYIWNTMIRAYSNTKSHNPDQSLLLFMSMQHQEHQTLKPDNFTYPFLLKSCSHTRRIFEGKQFHSQIYKMGFKFDTFIQNSLIHMYSSWRDFNSASQVFEKMSNRDVVSWTSLINGYVDSDHPIEALKLFKRMEQEQNIKPNEATVVSVLRACAETGALGVGKKLHRFVKNCGIEAKPNISTALIDMYAKCGSIENAKKVFDSIQIKNRDVFTWTAMISGLANHGKCKVAIDLFDEMEELEIRPNERTITAVLTACRNAGWIKNGYSYFNQIEKKYGIIPTIQHYGCMVDLLARMGKLENAENFIKTMPIEPDIVLWRSFLWGCKVHGDIERSNRLLKQSSDKLLQMDYSDTGSYILLENVYASNRKWREKAKVRQIMSRNGLIKPKGSSKIEVNETIHEFTAGDTSHPDSREIYKRLDGILDKLKLEGYVPKLSEVLLDIEDEEKAFQLHHHSEKIAVAFGLIKLNSGSEIRVVKNLRSCEDCHLVMKMMSKIYERRIVIRDRSRFHHFKDGKCSCNDYW